MKKFILIVCLLAASIVSAQDQSVKDDVQKLIKAIGISQRIDAMREYERMWTKPEEEKEYMVKFEATIPVFLQNVESYYLKNYTHDEIKELLKFYESPLGKKVTANSANLNVAYSGAEEKWDELFYEVFFKYKESKSKTTKE